MNSVAHIQSLIAQHGLTAAAEKFARSQNLTPTPEGEPAIDHLACVHRYARAAGLSKSYCASAWLLGLVDARCIDVQHLTDGFGIECAMLVQAVAATGANDHERRERQIAQLNRTPWATDLLLADLLAHLTHATARKHAASLQRYIADGAAYVHAFERANRSLFAQLHGRMSDARRALDTAPSPSEIAALIKAAAPPNPGEYYSGKNLPSWVREVLAKRGDSDVNPYLEALRKQVG